MSLDTFDSARAELAEHTPDFSRETRDLPLAGDVDLAVGLPHLGVILKGLPAAAADLLQEDYAPFLRTPGAPGAEWRSIQVHRHSKPHLLVPVRGESYRIHEDRQEGEARTWSYGFQAAWPETPAQPGHLWLCSDDRDGTARALNNFFKVYFAWESVTRDGVLFHSSGLVRKGKAHLFFGHSGSGKSTVVGLSPEAKVLSDDLVSVRLEGGRLVASGTPLRDKIARRDTTGEAYPVAGFFRLVQSPTDRLEALSAARAMAEMVASVPFMNHRTYQGDRVADNVAKMLPLAPVFRLHFTKSNRFWSVLEQAGL